MLVFDQTARRETKKNVLKLFVVAKLTYSKRSETRGQGAAMPHSALDRLLRVDAIDAGHNQSSAVLKAMTPATRILPLDHCEVGVDKTLGKSTVPSTYKYSPKPGIIIEAPSTGLPTKGRGLQVLGSLAVSTGDGGSTMHSAGFSVPSKRTSGPHGSPRRARDRGYSSIQAGAKTAPHDAQHWKHLMSTP